jgi:hypothetical protein
MRDYGFKRVLDDVGHLVRGLALLGLAGAPPLHPASAKRVFDAHNLDLEQVVAGVTAASEKWGIPSISRSGGVGV